MKRRFHLSFLLLAGILMLGAGLIGLTTVPDLMQYAFIPQAETDALMPASSPAETEARRYRGSWHRERRTAGTGPAA